jgi:hypothetical protein
MFQTKVVEKIKTYILHSKSFFPKIMAFMRSAEKYCNVGHVTDDGACALQAG